MKNQTEKFLAVLQSLEREGVEYVLIGGFAVALHGASRFTEDIDLFVRNNEHNLDKVRTALKSIFNDESISEITKDELSKYSVIRYYTTEDFYIDIIANLGEAFSFDDIKYEVIIFEGEKVRIATLETLMKLKEKTYREIDKLDLLFLAKKISEQKID